MLWRCRKWFVNKVYAVAVAVAVKSWSNSKCSDMRPEGVGKSVGSTLDSCRCLNLHKSPKWWFLSHPFASLFLAPPFIFPRTLSGATNQSGALQLFWWSQRFKISEAAVWIGLQSEIKLTNCCVLPHCSRWWRLLPPTTEHCRDGCVTGLICICKQPQIYTVQTGTTQWNKGLFLFFTLTL